MQEISYQIFDKTSGLPIYSMTDKFIRDMAERTEKSCSEVFNRIKSEIEKHGIQYFVSNDKKTVRAIAGPGLFKCQGEYFSNYEDALSFSKS